MLLPHVTDVAAKDRSLHRGSGQEVEWNLKEDLAVEVSVPLPGGMELRLASCVMIAAEQQVQHRHEVRLAGAERAMQKGSTRLVLGNGRDNQTECVIECGDEAVGDDVLADRLRGVFVFDPRRQLENEVAFVDDEWDINEFTDQSHGQVFFFRPRPVAGGRHSASSVRAIPNRAHSSAT